MHEASDELHAVKDFLPTIAGGGAPRASAFSGDLRTGFDRAAGPTDMAGSRLLLSVAILVGAVVASAVTSNPQTYDDNYTELALRFRSREPGVRLMKDALYRDILNGFHSANIEIASTSTEIGLQTPVEVRLHTAD